MTTGNQHQAEVIGIMGATGCGKSHRLRKKIARPVRKRTLIWSPKEKIDRYQDYFAGSIVCTTASEVLRALQRAGKSGSVHIVFVPTLDRKKDEKLFGIVCKMAMQAGNLTFIVDEVHTVTRPTWAPDGWSELIMMGRGYGIKVFALSQRPASMDKDFFSNMSALNVGRMAFDDDVKTVAKALRVPIEDVQNLTGFQWIERDVLTGKVTKG